VGALASVAGLGVSVAGFAVALRRLGRLGQNLNEGMGRRRAELERLHLQAELLRMAELTSAWQQLDGACRTGLPGRAGELLREAERCFQKYRNYCHALIGELRPLGRPQLTLPQVLELYGRYFACTAAELEANFLPHDFTQWRYRHEVIVSQLNDACASGPREMLRCRVDALGLVRQSEFLELKEQVVVTHDACRENRERLLTAGQEVDWLDRQRVAPEEYLRSLRPRRREWFCCRRPADGQGGTRLARGRPAGPAGPRTRLNTREAVNSARTRSGVSSATPGRVSIELAAPARPGRPGQLVRRESVGGTAVPPPPTSAEYFSTGPRMAKNKAPPRAAVLPQPGAPCMTGAGKEVASIWRT
jgi:hypothetical protein